MWMLRLTLPFIAVSICAGLCIADPAKPATEAKTFTADEVSAAEKTVGALTPEQQLVINNLRYLLRPGYEAELMAGRRFRPCTLPPFEEVPVTAMTQLEIVRLLAVLRSGMPATPAVEKHLSRFLALPLPTVKNSLAPYGLQLMLCVAATANTGFANKEMVARATALIESAMEIRDVVEEKSAYVGKTIDPRWFMNHLWRAVVCRCALALGLGFNEKVWEKDLRALNGVFEKDRGWASSKRDDLRNDYDLCTNYASLAALSLAISSPPGTVNDGLLRTLEKRFKDATEVLARLEKDYPFERLDGLCLAFVASLAPTLAPGKKLAADWQAAVLRIAAGYEPTGAVKARRSLASNMELAESRFDRVIVETAFSVVGVSGGFMPRGGPLAPLDLATIGRSMHALSVLHAHNIPKDSDGFGDMDPAAEDAIRLGCEHLESIQNSNGSFPGMNASYSGNTALALLAMMHGGWDRNSGPIKKGLEWLLDYDADKIKRGTEVAGVGYANTYSDAIVLMFLQKYYEREQASHGVFWADDKGEFEKARKKVWEEVDGKHRSLIDKLVKNLDDAHVNTDKGGFGYYPNGVAPGGLAGVGATYSDNSCSQYAILGYKAASLLGAKVNTDKLKHEAKRLVDQYFAVEGMDEVELVRPADEKKSSSKEWKGKIRPGGWGYISGTRAPPSLQMTAAGISSLVVCQDELKVRGELDSDFERSIELAIHGAQAWLATAYYTGGKAGGLGSMLKAGGADGWGVYYNLYSVERACVISGAFMLGKDIDWYEIGATALIEEQNPEGNWGPERPTSPSTVNDCLAILFLKKASLPVITDPRRRQPKPDAPPPSPEPDKGPITGK